MKNYFNNLSDYSANLFADQSFGPDALFNLMIISNHFQKVFIGLQMKNYFSGISSLSQKDIVEEAEKMDNIIEQMGAQTRNQYSCFYYVIVCPSYAKEVNEKYFSKSYQTTKEKTEFKLTKNDYVAFPFQTTYHLKTILLHPKYVCNITDQEFINAQKTHSKIQKRARN